MYNPFKPLEHIITEVFTTLPGKYRKKSRSAWSDPNRQNAEVECFLEGPAFDREGNLWVCDIPFGRIFRITPKGDWDLVLQYDGWPNGMKFHKDGRRFICDYKEGLLTLDPKTGKLENVLRTAYSESFKGLNDLHFTKDTPVRSRLQWLLDDLREDARGSNTPCPRTHRTGSRPEMRARLSPNSPPAAATNRISSPTPTSCARPRSQNKKNLPQRRGEHGEI